MAQDFSGQIALVTGASRGLGFALAHELGARGAHVVAVARTVGGLEDLADMIEKAGGSSTLVPLDINDDGGVQRMCLAIHERWGKADWWFHTATHTPPLAPVGHITEKDLKKTEATGIHAFARLVTMVDPLLRAAPGGHAVVIDEQVSGQPLYGTYGMVKAAQRALIESWKAENAKTGPAVTLHTPPPMPTAHRGRWFPGQDRDALTKPAEAARALLDTL
ncbi:MAG: SDR family NAD(P)-dependent oxidoreductase [Rubricella sp.]